MTFRFQPKKLLAGLATTAFLGLPITLVGTYLGPNPSIAAAQSDAPVPSESPGSRSGSMHRHMHHLGRILKSLNLSDDQKAQIHAIMKEAREKSKGADAETRRANMKQAFAQIDQVLTPEQREEFHAKLQAWRREHPQPEPTS